VSQTNHRLVDACPFPAVHARVPDLTPRLEPRATTFNRRFRVDRDQENRLSRFRSIRLL
jgi:hypothetical protein